MGNSERVLSYYAASAVEKTCYPELDQPLCTAVCVIGGGFSGIATAFELVQRGYSVAVLESKKIGWGASGRNGGQLIRGIGHGAEVFLPDIGQDGVDAIENIGLEGVNDSGINL